MLHQEEVNCLQFECNTNEIQTEITFESVVTCIEKGNFEMYCCVETLSKQQNVSEAKLSETLQRQWLHKQQWWLGWWRWCKHDT